MPIAIKMPALSPTMEEGTLAKWLVKVGDKVSSGDIMAEIETDKATMEFEAVDEGTIADIAVAEGTEGVKVGTVIATLAEEGEDLAERQGGGARRRSAAHLGSRQPATRARAAEARLRAAAAERQRPLRLPRMAKAASGDRVIASPLAKRIAADKGIDLAERDGQRPQRPHRQGRRRGRAARRRARRGRRSAPPPAQPGETPVRRGKAQRHAQDDRAPPDRIQAAGPAHLPHGRHPARRAAQAARRAQRRARGARGEALGQRHADQGARPGAARRCRAATSSSPATRCSSSAAPTSRWRSRSRAG